MRWMRRIGKRGGGKIIVESAHGETVERFLNLHSLDF